MRLAAAFVVLTACASLPATHRYTLEPPARPPAPLVAHRDDLPVLTVDELEVDAAYDDPRIAYRPSAFRFEYYHYHRWSAPPSLLLSEYFRAALARTGRFARVTRTLTPHTDLVLRGRLTAFEEVDVTKERWIGRVGLELFLEEPTSGRILWSHRFDEREPLVTQSPAGLARALSVAMQRIVGVVLPAAARLARAEQRSRAEARLER